MEMGWHPGDPTWENLATFSHELLQKIRVLIIDRFNGDVDAPTRHGAVGAAKC